MTLPAPIEPPPDPAHLADRLVQRCVDCLEALAETFGGLDLPGAVAGFEVDPDTRADLAHTLGLLHACGIGSLAGAGGVEPLTRSVLGSIHGPKTNPFSAYRVAETLDRLGIRGDAIDANLDAATDASGWVALLDVLPRNYAVVLARCLLARRALGLAIDDAALADLLERSRALLRSEVAGWIDDSHGGEGRFDIYSADVHLFAEPLAAELDPDWSTGMAATLDHAAGLGARNGATHVWGRSTGVLSVCLTIELAAHAVRHQSEANRSMWLARLDRSERCLDGWFADGLITAHVGRSPYAYRGPARRLQLTFDVLGKLAVAALDLRAAAGEVGAPVEAYPPVDRLLACEATGTASVWTYRSERLAFQLAFVGGTRSDYLSAPQQPGTFEVPVDSALACGVPMAISRGVRYVPAGRPTSLEHRPGEVSASWDGLVEPADLDRALDPAAAPRRLPGRREATITVEGRTIVVAERLSFGERVPQALTLQVPETPGRPLAVSFDAPAGSRQATVEVGGVAEYRSFWGQLARVHQLDLRPAHEVSFSWSVAPKLRVSSTDVGHPYHRTIYDHLVDLVVESAFPTWKLADVDALTAALADVDIVHLHWPEWLTGPSRSRTNAAIEACRRAEVRVVWTMHNLDAHSGPSCQELYAAWAQVVDLVLHHSAWGRDQALATYAFGDGCRHVVLAHPHWGEVFDLGPRGRDATARSLGLPPAGLRLGVVGAPRPNKDVQCVIDAVASCRRDDVSLVVWSGAGETVPDDPRIVVEPYEMVAPGLYAERLGALDALVLPFGEGMLTTGTVGDAIAAGLGCITTPWPYLAEALGDAAIGYDGTVDGLRDLIEGLAEARVVQAGEAAVALRPAIAPRAIATTLAEVLDELGTVKV